MNRTFIENNFIDIDKIISDKELCAYYQPIFDTSNNRIVAAEALARIVKSNGEIVPPNNFIPFLEDSKAALKLDWYIVEEVCKLLSELKKAGQRVVPIAINFSKMHAIEEDFIERLDNLTNKYDVDHGLIHIELHEDTLQYLADDTKFIMSSLRSKGYKISVDDFGKGTASLIFIREMEFDLFKIDRSVIAGKLETERDKKIVKALINLGYSLDADVVVQGVETKEQLQILKELGCKHVQGFYLSRPISQVVFTKHLL